MSVAGAMLTIDSWYESSRMALAKKALQAAASTAMVPVASSVDPGAVFAKTDGIN